MTILQWIKNVIDPPQPPGRFAKTTLTKVEVFRRMKHEQREAERTDTLGMHPYIVNRHRAAARDYADALEEMNLLGTDAVEREEWEPL